MPATDGVRAAQYVRMSTEHQSYSIEYQMAANTAYALAHDYELVRTYADPGVSGLTLKRRPGLRALLADVLGGRADYAVVLVYDVSRWGRFQDPDQSAHYEFICREAGVAIEYCAEPFANDGSLTATLVKHLKRAMAAEYSRELSEKVSRAHLGLGAMGYWQGGPPGFGLRRKPVSADGKARAVLEAGEHNGVSGDRVRLVHGPQEEVELIRQIFRMFLIWGLSTNAIARTLNGEGRLSSEGARWTTARIRRILRSEKYAGTIVVGQSRCRLGRRTRPARDQWVRAPGAVEPIVTREVFESVQRQFRFRKPRCSDDDLLGALRVVLAERGRLSFRIIQEDARTPCPGVYVRRFGGLAAAYRLVGYQFNRQQALAAERIRQHLPHTRREFPRLSDEELLAKLSALREETGKLSVDLIDGSPGLPNAEHLRRRFGGMARVYQLVGYIPTERQVAAMARPKGG